MFVRELMTTDMVTVPADITLRDAIRRMLFKEVGYVVVVDEDGNPGGFITETDVLHAVYQAEPPPSEISVVDVAHPPEFTVGPNTTIGHVARKMIDRNERKVPVMDDLELVGVLTLSDIVAHLSDIRQDTAGNSRNEWGVNE